MIEVTKLDNYSYIAEIKFASELKATYAIAYTQIFPFQMISVCIYNIKMVSGI